MAQSAYAPRCTIISLCTSVHHSIRSHFGRTCHDMRAFHDMTCLRAIALVFILYHCMDMQDAKQTKRQRLVALAHGPTYVSQRGLSQTLESVRLRGIPDASSRKTLWRSRRAAATRDTPHGTLTYDMELPLKIGPIAITVANPAAMLHLACKEADGFASRFRERLQAPPPSATSPWRSLCYNDEIGHNPLAPGDDTRKIQGAYWTMLELGIDAIHSENGWFIAAAVRSFLIKDLPGGISNMNKLLLKQLFFNSETGIDF